MKIGFICNEYPPATCGGIGTFVRELAERLVAEGHQVTIVGVYANVDQREERQQQGVTVIQLPAQGGLSGIYVDRRSLFVEVKTLSEAGQIDLIEIPDFEGYAAFWGKLSIPIVVRLHGTATYFSQELGQRPSRLVRWLEQQTLNKATQLISVSHYAARETLNVFSLKMPYNVIHNGVSWPDDTQCKKDYSATGSVVFTGSLMYKKGVFALAEAWPEVQKQYPNAQLILVGKDTQQNGQSVRSLLEQKVGKSANLMFTGHINKATLQDHLRYADVAIFPSFSESFGLGPVESMALAVPTIYTELSCGPEIVQHEQNGLLINPSEPHSIAAALKHLLSDQQQREQLGRAGRVHARQFSVDTQIANNVTAYQQLITKG